VSEWPSGEIMAVPVSKIGDTQRFASVLADDIVALRAHGKKRCVLSLRDGTVVEVVEPIATTASRIVMARLGIRAVF
jgi:hypothetical protein